MPDETDVWTGLRILPALHVLVLHETLDFGWRNPSLANTFLLRTAAVSFFFMLSGFLLTRGYWAFRFKRQGRWTFLVGRLARLYPLYLLGLALYTPFYLFRQYVPPGAASPPLAETVLLVAKHLLVVQAWFPADACTLNCPSWSVSALVVFSLLFGPVLFGLRRLRPRSILWLAAACYVASQAIVLGMQAAGLDDMSRQVLHKNPLVRLPEFLFGMCVGALFATGRLDMPWIRHPATFPAAGAAAILLFLLLPWGWNESIHNGLLLPLLALVVVALPHHKGPAAAWLRHPRLVQAGALSFAFYILHIPVANALDFLGWAVTGQHWRYTWPFILVDIAATFLVAIPAQRWVEDPARRRITHWYRRSAQARRNPTAV